ncbi:hypothetical protein PSTT_12974, partial [Puccinia striiformis]
SWSDVSSTHRPTRTVQQTSPSQSRSRSRIRGLLTSPGRSGEHPNSESSDHPRHGIHHWNGLSSIRLGRRREEPVHAEPQPEAQGPRLYSSRSADRLGNSPAANNNHSNSANPEAPPDGVAPQIASDGYQRPRAPSHHSVVARPSGQSSGSSHNRQQLSTRENPKRAIVFEALHLEQVAIPLTGHPHRGRQEESASGSRQARADRPKAESNGRHIESPPAAKSGSRLAQRSRPRASNMEPFPLSETTKLENLHQRFKRACRNKDYRKLLRRESRKDLYLNTHAKRFNLQTVVDHPRICLLRMTDDSAPLQLLGTLPVPPRVVQGQILSRPATVNGSPDGDEDAERPTRLISELELVFMGPT